MTDHTRDDNVQETDHAARTARSTRVTSLDDVAAQFMKTDPKDLESIRRLHDSLRVLNLDPAESQNAVSLVNEAIERAGELVSRTADKPDIVLTEIGELIARASGIAGQPASDSTPATIPEDPPPSCREEASQGCSDAGGFVLPPGSDADLVGEFITESREYIDQAEAALLTLETDPEDSEAVNTVFRGFHTIKGTSSFLGFEAVAHVAHRAESLLSRVRDREIRCSGGYADLALRSVDMMKALMQIVEDALGGAACTLPDGLAELLAMLSDPEGFGIDESTEIEASEPPRIGDLLVDESRADRDEVEAAAALKGSQPIGVALVRSGTASVSEVAQALRTQNRIARQPSSVDSSVRVRTDRLDRLIEMVGELVIAHSMIAQDDTVVLGKARDLSRKVSHTGKIVRELQDLSMSMRMVPMRSVFQKMARLVRDLSAKSGKQVRLVTQGEDTEIDRNMVDVLGDPLVHMVRNAVDHGIEPSGVRADKGKDPCGTICLSARHSGGSVVLELKDDGRGLDRDTICKQAIAKGLIDSDRNMSDGEVFNHIFEPGFSTAEKITDISGRGVGMDVVKKGLMALRGKIDISSLHNQGSTFTIRLPLTLAITDGMLVKVGQQRYIIPTVNISVSTRPTSNELLTVAGRGELAMLRGDLMPMHRLHRLFDIKGAVEDPTEGILVIVGDGDRRCAILVDNLLGQHQVVARSLGGIGKSHGVSGGAILGDGRVGLILDTTEIAALAQQTGSPSLAEDRKGYSLRDKVAS